jgi:hypothetical protein
MDSQRRAAGDDAGTRPLWFSPPDGEENRRRVLARDRVVAIQIVDLYHAREHLTDLARSLEFMPGDQKDDWLAARMEDLDYGDSDGICAAARATAGSRSRGLLVGSGVVEAGCKAVIGQRL